MKERVLFSGGDLLGTGQNRMEDQKIKGESLLYFAMSGPILEDFQKYCLFELDFFLSIRIK